MLSALLLTTGCFVSQTFFLPVFGWSFLLLATAWLSIEGWHSLRPMRLPLSQWALLALAVAYLAFLVATSKRTDSSTYLLSSMSCALLAASIYSRRPKAMYLAIRYFLGLNVAAVLAGLLAQFILSVPDFIFILSDTSDYLRFRGISREPNHLGLSLNAIYIIVLFSHGHHIRWTKPELHLTIAIIWFLAFLTASMFTLPCLVLTTLIYGWTTTSRKVKSTLFIFVVLLGYVSSDRFERTISGEDNSANLRTWGSLIIAQEQVSNCGLAGCGLGSARSVLEDEPQMKVFAAQELNGLPNLFAGAMVEGGYVLAGFIFAMILLASRPLGSQSVRNTARCSLAIGLLLFLCAMSGSHPYDAQFWSLLGLLFVLARQGATPGRAAMEPRRGST